MGVVGVARGMVVGETRPSIVVSGSLGAGWGRTHCVQTLRIG
jgi:hypothetical protein